MADQNYTATFTVSKTPDEVFNSINNVRGWWSGDIDGETDKLNAEFTYRVKDVHKSTQKITELTPGKKIVWHVTDGHLNFVKDTDEWKGTDIVFDISKNGDHTDVRFTHIGLAPKQECYGTCSGAWDAIIKGNLRNFIETGKQQPSPFGA